MYIFTYTEYNGVHTTEIISSVCLYKYNSFEANDDDYIFTFEMENVYTVMYKMYEMNELQYQR